MVFGAISIVRIPSILYENTLTLQHGFAFYHHKRIKLSSDLTFYTKTVRMDYAGKPAGNIFVESSSSRL